MILSLSFGCGFPLCFLCPFVAIFPLHWLCSLCKICVHLCSSVVKFPFVAACRAALFRGKFQNRRLPLFLRCFVVQFPHENRHPRRLHSQPRRPELGRTQVTRPL